MKDLADYYGQSPSKLDSEAVQGWLYHLVIERKL